MSLLRRVADLAVRHGPTVVRQVRRAQARRASSQAPGPRPTSGGATGTTYAPRADGRPDPGEVVWGWVPYEDDPTQGKDRPVLLVGRQGAQWMGLYLTSKDNTRDAADEARWGRHWMDVGTGAWDSRRRPSEVRLDRLVLLDETAIRREGAALARPVFDAVVSRAKGMGTF